jgi:DinB family protein
MVWRSALSPPTRSPTLRATSGSYWRCWEPATRWRVLAAIPAAIQQRTTLLAGEALGRRPAAGEWSVTELVGHLWDAEIAYAFRARLIVTRDRARLIGYDQEAWARLARPPFAELVVAFTALRTANLVLIRGTPVTWWDRLGIHEERGPTSFRLATETIAGHDRAHLLQLDQTITALQR